MKAVKKPVVVDVFKYSGDESAAFSWVNSLANRDMNTILLTSHGIKGYGLYITTLEGLMHVPVGNYIICGIKGELYSCEPNIFSETYNLIEQDDPEDWF